MIVLIFSIAAVGMLVVGLSLTLMIKGRHIDGEISTNRNMQALGITCAVHSANNGAGSGAGSASACTDLCTSCAASDCIA